MAPVEYIGLEVLIQLFLKLVDLFRSGYLVFRHDIKQFLDTVTEGSQPESDKCSFLRLVLRNGFFIEMGEAKLYIRIVFFEELREVQAFPAFIGLLIKINGANAVLVIF